MCRNIVFPRNIGTVRKISNCLFFQTIVLFVPFLVIPPEHKTTRKVNTQGCISFLSFSAIKYFSSCEPRGLLCAFHNLTILFRKIHFMTEVSLTFDLLLCTNEEIDILRCFISDIPMFRSEFSSCLCFSLKGFNHFYRILSKFSFPVGTFLLKIT